MGTSVGPVCCGGSRAAGGGGILLKAIGSLVCPAACVHGLQAGALLLSLLSTLFLKDF